MVYHDWSDKNIDFEGIEAAAYYIKNFCIRYARLGGQAKEKYGTVRFYASFGYLSLHTLFYPGYAFSQFPKWLWKLDCDLGFLLMNSFLNELFIKWQAIIYRKAYKNALKKWSHLREEILCGADHKELLEGL